jgi:hypothetical protein
MDDYAIDADLEIENEISMKQHENEGMKRDMNTETPVIAATTALVTSAVSVVGNLTSTQSYEYRCALAMLKKHWGYEVFRPGQFELIDSVARLRRDAYVTMATGAGQKQLQAASRLLLYFCLLFNHLLLLFLFFFVHVPHPDLCGFFHVQANRCVFK